MALSSTPAGRGRCEGLPIRAGLTCTDRKPCGCTLRTAWSRQTGDPERVGGSLRRRHSGDRQEAAGGGYVRHLAVRLAWCGSIRTGGGWQVGWSRRPQRCGVPSACGVAGDRTSFTPVGWRLFSWGLTWGFADQQRCPPGRVSLSKACREPDQRGYDLSQVQGDKAGTLAGGPRGRASSGSPASWEVRGAGDVGGAGTKGQT